MGKKSLRCYAFMKMWGKEFFLSFLFPWNFSGKSHCVITATNKGLKQYEKNKAGGEGRKRRWLIMNVKALFTHTWTISSFERKNAEKSTHTHFLHFYMHNGPLKESTSLVILLHRGFVMLVKRQYFEWLCVFSFFMLSAREMKLTEGGFFFL